jgi:glycosyltransferase involved in cell wall biosynthesis
MSRPLRVVSICRTLPTPDDPAAGIFVLQRLAAMQQLVELTVRQPIPYFPGIKRMPAWARVRCHRVGSVDINHVPMLYVPGVLKRADGAWLAAAIEPQVAALHRERPLDLIDAHFGFPDGVGASRVAARLGLPVFVTIRGNETEWVANAAVRGQLARALADATGCIAVSQFMRDVAVDLGTEASAIRVIANAVDEKIFHAGDRKDARRRLGLEDHVPLLVSVGNLIQRKRQHVLIEAFAEAKRRIPDASLVMIGSDLQEP